MTNNRIAPFLWLHQEPVEDVIAEIERIYQCGITSICLESRTYEDFGKEQWWNDLAVIFAECEKRHMQVWILDDKHFPSGYGNGIYEEKYKELRQSVITENHLDVCGPVKDGSVILNKHLYSDKDKLLGVFAVKRIPQSDELDNEIIDLTTGIFDDMVYFDLPAGVYRIIFIIQTRAIIDPRYSVYADTLNKEASLAYIKEFYQPTYDKFAKYFGNTFLGFFADEPAFNNLTRKEPFKLTTLGTPFEIYPWNDAMTARYEKNIKNIISLWFDFSDNSHIENRICYMDAITNLYSDCYCQTIGNWCRKHRISYIGHIIEDNNAHSGTGCGAGHYFRALKGQDMPGVDVVLHQIMPGMTEYSTAGYVSYKHMNNKFFNYILAKLASSYAHFDQTKNGNALCEIFGAYGWAEGTKIMKYLADHMLVRGINYFVPHAFSPKKNDTDCPPNFYDSGKNPEYRYFRHIISHIEKSSNLLKNGIHVSTCAILYDAEFRWAGLNFIHEENIAQVLYDNQLDYDILPADVLGELTVKNSINGEKYNALIVPYCACYPKRIREVLNSICIPIIYVSENGEDGSVTLNNLVEHIKPDIKLLSSCKSLKYCHRKTNSSDIYMFVNEDIHNSIECDVVLDDFNGGNYWVYDSLRNTIKKHTKDNTINIVLEPYNSCFVFIGQIPPLCDAKETKIYCCLSEETINTTYNISLEEQNSGIKVPYKTVTKLENITSAKNMPHFSGHIYYDFDINLTDISNDIFIDLGYVGETAEIKVNGIDCGIAVVGPYEFNITAAAKQGVNHIEVMVSNHNGYKVRDDFSKFILFEPSGLLGDIKIKHKISH